MEEIVTSVENLIKLVKDDLKNKWKIEAGKTWFRGEPRETPTPLLPKLYRKNDKVDKSVELNLLQRFRMEAPMYINMPIPQRGHTDQWLFLAQHALLPTRLLDWTESLLVALYFALQQAKESIRDNNGNPVKTGGIVWMLNHQKLNELSETTNKDNKTQTEYSLTWFSPELDPIKWLRELLNPDVRISSSEKKKKIDFNKRLFAKLRSAKMKYNPANRNIRAAWENDERSQTKYPVAIYPTYIHQRISLQQSRFTIWGKCRQGLNNMENIDENILRKYVLDDNNIDEMINTLRILGISKLTLYPELDSLAKDLEQHFYPNGVLSSNTNQFNKSSSNNDLDTLEKDSTSSSFSYPSS